MSHPPAPRANPLLVGHDAARLRFERARHSGRLPHAWLIEGEEGIGKATFAYALARRLLAGTDGTDVDDLKGPVFRQVATGGHPDLRVLKREIDPKTRKLRREILVDQVRDQITAMLATSAWNGQRVLIVDTADDLNPNAANALLKFLEEPPSAVVILLVCHNPGGVLPTILSRCARLRLKPLPGAEVAALLPRLDPAIVLDEARALAELAAGSPGRALVLREHGVVQAYATVLQTLSSPLPPLERGLLAAEHLERLLNGGTRIAVGVLLDLVRRKAMQAAGRPLEPELLKGEAKRLEALAPGAALDRWLGLWDKLARLPSRVDGLNLDAKQALLLASQAIVGADPGLVDGGAA